jgi:hypothetical protein
MSLSLALISKLACLISLLAPIYAAVAALHKHRLAIQYKGWFLCTSIFLAYLWVWFVFLMLIVPSHFMTAIYWPANTSESPPEFFLVVSGFIALHELQFIAVICLGASLWISRYFVPEWKRDFKDQNNA